MTELICRIFVKSRDTSDPKAREAYGTLAGAVGIVLNFILCVFKILAGVISGSVAIVADALNNLSDAAAQVISGGFTKGCVCDYLQNSSLSSSTAGSTMYAFSAIAAFHSVSRSPSLTIRLAMMLSRLTLVIMACFSELRV